MTSTPSLDLDQARFNMIEQQIRPWEVLDSAVLALLDRIRRDRFVPVAHQALAYVDMELPLGGADGQVMLAPRVQARLVQDLAVQPTDKVLEIGTGSGFTTALLASLAERVVSLELDESLARQARDRLQAAGVSNAEVRVADATAGQFAACRTGEPWNVILVGGSLAEVPRELLDLLAPGGRLAAIVGHEPVMRATFITRESGAAFRTVQPWDTVAPRMRHFPESSRFEF
jgi:protein-L-isoaspartate(D-aspartate) O-methyltransferase